MSMLISSKQLVVLIAAIAVTAVGVGLIAQWSIGSTGNIVAIGLNVYSDVLGTVKYTSINWESIGPGYNKTMEAFVRLEGNLNSTLSIEMDNLVSVATYDQLLITWDDDGSVIVPQELRRVEITLAITEDAPLVSFQFDIIVIATAVVE